MFNLYKSKSLFQTKRFAERKSNWSLPTRMLQPQVRRAKKLQYTLENFNQKNTSLPLTKSIRYGTGLWGVLKPETVPLNRVF